MTKYLNVEEIEDQARSPHITAEELDILVSRTRDLSRVKRRELERVQKLLEELEEQLGIEPPPSRLGSGQ